MIFKDLFAALVLRPVGGELHQINCSGERKYQVKVGQVWSKFYGNRQAQKWFWIGLVAFIALQIYFVQEMMAALILFTGAFVVFALLALVFYLLDRASERSLIWMGRQARHGLATAEEISKKHLRRPRSETAQ